MGQKKTAVSFYICVGKELAGLWFPHMGVPLRTEETKVGKKRTAEKTSEHPNWERSCRNRGENTAGSKGTVKNEAARTL